MDLKCSSEGGFCFWDPVQISQNIYFELNSLLMHVLLIFIHLSYLVLYFSRDAL